MKKLIEQGKFRDDLFFRISVVQINLPPLRSRAEDISLLTDAFVKLFCSKLKKPVPEIEKTFYDKLAKYNFPGNTRELKNIIERIILLNDKPSLSKNDLPADLFFGDTSSSIKSNISLQEMEKQHIISVLKSTNNNKPEAAEILGIGLTTLYRKLNDYGLIVE